MHGKDYFCEDPEGWWISEKFDGVRALWCNSKFITKNGNPTKKYEFKNNIFRNIN